MFDRRAEFADSIQIYTRIRRYQLRQPAEKPPVESKMYKKINSESGVVHRN